MSADQEEAQVEARYDTAAGRTDVRIVSQGMNVAALGKQASLAAVPLLSQIAAGQWSGELNYRAEPGSDPVWTGNIVLQDGTISFPGFATPVLVKYAQGHMDADGVFLDRIRATAAGVTVEGDYQYESGEDSPHRFHLRTTAISGAALESFLIPTLHRQTGLFGIALHLGRRTPVPEWLSGWRAEGTLQNRQAGLAQYGPRPHPHPRRLGCNACFATGLHRSMGRRCCQIPHRYRSA